MSELSEKDMKIIKQLLTKPSQPLIIPDDDREVVFSMPQRYYNKKYRNHVTEINESFHQPTNQVVSVKNTNVPEKTVEKASEINLGFSVFVPRHADIASELIEKFMAAPTVEDLISIAAFTRERVSPVLFAYAFTIALLHRSDTKNVELPNFVTTFPGKFLDASVFTEVRRSANLLPAESREPILIRRNFTASNREPEQAVAYFREDIGINLHHWHWHLVYPARGGTNIVNKDRRGELFFYMHQQVLARYNAERLCNKMEFVKPFDNITESIPEGYFPKLNQLNSNRAWPPRFMNTYLKDIDRPSDRLTLNIDTVREWIETIKTAILRGEVKNSNGKTIVLDPVTGIDILGNLVEATDMSVNRQLYGNLHNMVHVLIAFCHDPQDRYLEGFSLMGDTATAMRDPIFYRWHAAINELFLSHKYKLPPYTIKELGFDKIEVQNITVQSVGGQLNEINTFWESSIIDISRGLDFMPKGALPISITYLQHKQFTYTIDVNNKSSQEVKGTVRIFMSPKYNLRNTIFMMDQMRQLMIELDKFSVTLKPGINTFSRSSLESSVTIEYEKTFRNVDTSKMTMQQFNQKNFCGCGWPDHMLVPRGTVEGLKANLFVMVSDYNADRVDQDIGNMCLGADSYCGLFNRKYPDKRNMGYPFDRPVASGVTDITQFTTPNMKVVEIQIKHKDEVVPRPPEATPTVSAVST